MLPLSIFARERGELKIWGSGSGSGSDIRQTNKQTEKEKEKLKIEPTANLSLKIPVISIRFLNVVKIVNEFQINLNFN